MTCRDVLLYRLKEACQSILNATQQLAAKVFHLVSSWEGGLESSSQTELTWFSLAVVSYPSGCESDR